MLFLISDYAFVAQQVERTAVNRDVGGSSPPESVAFSSRTEPWGFHEDYLTLLGNRVLPKALFCIYL